MAGYAEDELVLRAQARDEAAFSELMRRTEASSLRLALSILRDREDAEDEVQSAYLKAWRHLAQFQRESKFSTWMSRIVVNHCLMRLRRLRLANFVYLDDVRPEERKRPAEVADRGATPEACLGGLELSALLKKEIRSLPPLLQHVLVLRDVDELSTGEVASRLGITAAAAKSRLLRARLELRNRLEKHCGRAGWKTLTAP